MVEFSPTLIFVAILFSVPIQFYLSPRSTSDAQYFLHKFVGELRDFYGRIVGSFLSISEETSREKSQQKQINNEEIMSDGMDEEKMRGLFGGSEEPRHPRPPHIKYRVGQVVKHKLHNYRGVIIGWDEKVKAPEWWIKRVHGDEEVEGPNYSMLIDTRDRLVPQIAYVLEKNVVLSEGAVVHPLINHYFESFDGTCYKSRPWHKKVYPND